MPYRFRIGSCLIVFSLLLATGCASAFSQEQPPDAEAAHPTREKKVVAMVNGEPVYQDKLDLEMSRNWNAMKIAALQKDQPEVLKQLERNALDSVIESELILQESRKLKLSDEEIDQRVAQQLKALETKYGSAKAVDGYLKRRALTVEGYKKNTRTKVRVEEYLKRQGISNPEVPEAEIRQMYDLKPESFSRKEGVRVSHILISVDPHGGPDAQEQARKQAEQIRAEIIAGKDFGEMAKKHSKCNSAAGGGDLGYVQRGYMPKEFELVTFTAEKDAVSAVVKTKFGYHIIKVTDKVPSGVVPYKEVRDFIRKYLQDEESKKRLASNIAELKKKAKIEVLLK